MKLRRQKSTNVGSLPHLEPFDWLLLFFINTTMLRISVAYTIGPAAASFLYRVIAVVLAIAITKHALKSRNVIDLILIVGLYLIAVMISIAMNPRLESILGVTLSKFLTCLGGYYLFSQCDISRSLDRMTPYCAILILPYCALILSSTSIDHYNNSEYFGISYGIVLQVCLLLLNNKHNIIILLSGILGTCVIIFAGARGAFLCVVVAAALALVFDLLKAGRHGRVLYILATMVVAAMIISLSDEMMVWLQNLMPESRTLARLTSENYGYDSSRLTMYQTLWDAIARDPFQYRGVLSDRLVGANVWSHVMLSGDGSLAGTYAHNIFFEVLYQNGVLLGSLILVGLIYGLVHAYRFANSKEGSQELRLLAILLGCGIAQLMVSSSYLINMHFWYLLGYVASTFRWSERESNGQDRHLLRKMHSSLGDISE